MHLLPVLGALERKRNDEPLAVIGVHSAKFDAENDAARIREAMARYGVRHPVVVDRGHAIWQSYAVRSWPTLVVIRPDGTIAAVAPGEADVDALDEFVGKLLDDAREDGTLARQPFRPERPPGQVPGVLAFPGKLIALPEGRLAVSDTGHDRVLLLDADGRVEDTIGGGAPGFEDGAFGEALLHGPQGLAFDADTRLLYVADTFNHAIREADLGRRRVRTIAGTGSLGRGIPRGPVPARQMPLRSPWDLALAGDWLLVAMAGAHQIWAFNPADETIGVLAGAGHETIRDGPLPEAAFAQPSGLALAGTRLYLADSETSAVRYLDLSKGEVRTLVGTGLFDFGDRDGEAAQALLQHPIGISHGPAGLLVADSYNDKIKRVDEASGAVTSFFAGADGIALREPAGLCQLGDGRVVVADTNYHRLVVVSADGARAELLEVREPERGPVATTGAGEGPRPISLPHAAIGADDVTLRITLETPPGLDLSQGSRVSIRVKASGSLHAPEADQGFEVRAGRRGVPVLLLAEAGGAEIEIEVEATACSHGDAAACWPLRARYRLPVRVEESGRSALDARLALPDPR